LLPVFYLNYNSPESCGRNISNPYFRVRLTRIFDCLLIFIFYIVEY
jgi:hypothetical protein